MDTTHGTHRHGFVPALGFDLLYNLGLVLQATQRLLAKHDQKR